MKRIALTPAQWKALKPLVDQGRQAERSLGLPVEVINGDQQIQNTAERIVILLDEE